MCVVVVVVVVGFVFAQKYSLQGFKNQSDLAKNLSFFKLLVLFFETRAVSPFTKRNLKFVVQTTETHYNEYLEILLEEIEEIEAVKKK